MPKRTTLPNVPDLMEVTTQEIQGIPTDTNKLIVQKSNPLQSLSETGMTLSEFKLLDAYLSRIDSHKPSNRFIRFEKGELEQILGVKRILNEDLNARLDGLFKIITIKDRTKDDGFTKISLFEKAVAQKDSDGLWQIELACTSSAMEYFFNIESLGYLPYMLKNVIELTSRYSYVLYLYLERNKFRNSWEIDVDSLKTMLRCTADSYNAYKEFNDKILKKCYKELNEKTTLRFSYEPTERKNRKVTKIRFTIESAGEELSAVSYSEYDLSSDDIDDIDYGSELANLLGNACNNEFSKVQIRVIQDLVIKASGTTDNLERTDYLVQKLHAMDYYESKHPINDRFAYLKYMLENDIKGDNR